MLTPLSIYHNDSWHGEEPPRARHRVVQASTSEPLGNGSSACSRFEERLFFSHATDRMDERGITTLDVLRVLRVGDIVGEIEAGKGTGEWKCKIVERRRRAREIGVATVVMWESKLLIKTVEWEDL